MPPAEGVYFTIDQCADACYQAGFRGEALVIALAVIRHESSGGSLGWSKVNAVGDTHLEDATWGPSVGMFQIRSLKAETGKGTDRDKFVLSNPVRNAQSAVNILGGGTVTTGSSRPNEGWGHWSVWKNGSYRGAMAAAREAASRRESGSGAGSAGLAGIGAAINNAITDATIVFRGLLPGGQPIGGPPAVMAGAHDGGFARFPELNPYGVLADLRLHGFTSVQDVKQAVVGAPNIDLSSSEASKLTFTVEDKDYNLLRHGNFMIGGLVEFADLKFEITAIRTGGDVGPPTVSVDALPAAIQRLKRDKGALIVTNVSPSSFINYTAASAGLRFIGEDSAVRPHITRAGDDAKTTGDETETTWDVFQRLAQEVGYVCFETAGTIIFGRPTWLLTRTGVRSLVVRHPAAEKAGEVVPVKYPQCRRQEDPKLGSTAEVVVELHRTDALGLRPGDRLRLRGIPYFDTDYLVSQVTMDVDGRSNITVTAGTPVDPTPAPPDFAAEGGEIGAGWDAGLFPDLGGGAPVGQGDVAGPEAGNFGWDWPNRGQLVSVWGDARDGGRRRHKGVDVACPEGEPCRAARGGTISTIKYGSGYGNVVFVDHDGGFQTRYAHLLKFAAYTVGERVERGAVIGYVGNTGTSTGPHVHFEILLSGNHQDPQNYLKGRPPPFSRGAPPPRAA